MQQHPLRYITNTVHLLSSLPQDNNQGRKKSAHKLYAKGYLVGQFLFNNVLSSEDEVVFTGDFKGFFMDARKNHQSAEEQIYFEGCIENMLVESINNDSSKNELIHQLQDNTFNGYFKGIIQVQHRLIDLEKKVYTVSMLQKQQYLVKKQKVQILIPTFATFVLKNLNSIDFQSSNAKVSGTLTIRMQLSEDLMRRLENGNHTILMGLGRQNSIQLPLKRQGQKKYQDCFIQYSFTEKSKTMKYVIRKTFQTSIDNTHGQFYAPFNLIYLKIVLSFYELGIKLVDLSKDQHQCHQDSILESHHQGARLSLKFLCYDMDDTLQANNPYSTYNDLDKITDRKKQKLRNKVTKIHTLKLIQCGDYLVSTNNLSLFPFYRDTIGNQSKNSSSAKWNLGIQNRNISIVKPEVYSIDQQFENRAINQTSNVKKIADGNRMFQFKQWSHIHIQIPIYRYWYIYFIQICLPLLLLSAISMFIFLQENGLKQDGFSTFNQRIANGVALLLAYGGLIPVLKDHMAQSTFFSFFHLVIFFSIIPMILALVSSILDSRQPYASWKINYDPFKDPFFIISFAYVCFLVLVVVIVVILAIKVSLFDRQILVNYKKLKFKHFKDAAEPSCFKEYVRKIAEKRKGQYYVREIRDIDEFGHYVSKLSVEQQ